MQKNTHSFRSTYLPSIQPHSRRQPPPQAVEQQSEHFQFVSQAQKLLLGSGIDDKVVGNTEMHAVSYAVRRRKIRECMTNMLCVNHLLRFGNVFFSLSEQQRYKLLRERV
jgi:hypothetical protein